MENVKSINVLSSDIRNKLLDSLFNLRFSLSIRKITNPTIPLFEFKTLLDNEKTESKDELVSKELDKIFEEEVVKKESNVFSLDDMGRKIEDSSAPEKGQAKVLTSPYFKQSSTEDTTQRAA